MPHWMSTDRHILNSNYMHLLTNHPSYYGMSIAADDVDFAAHLALHKITCASSIWQPLALIKEKTMHQY